MSVARYRPTRRKLSAARLELYPLASHHDDLDVVAGRLGDACITRRIEAALDHGAVDDDRTVQVS